ncbi:MAG TPA: response regulator [Dissulfurispiraceae bacterium]
MRAGNEEVKILCVDDEQNVLNALKRLFLDSNYQIFTATSGIEGLEILAREQAQIIISDYRMPGMNGVEFLKRVCDEQADTVRIVLSGYADASAIVSAINEGQIYKFVPKPWNDDELKVTVANAIERYFLYKRNKELAAELKAKNDALAQLNRELEELLEFRSKVLAKHQNILDAIPAGILGIDLNNIVVLNNSMWSRLLGKNFCALGREVEDSMPRELTAFIEEVKSRRKASRELDINGTCGKLIGSLMDHEDNQKGIILVFCSEAGAI